jgi:N-acetylglutamate synthase
VSAEQPLILHLEELAAQAWPAAEIRPLAGWRLRFTAGVTRRANSVWPHGSVAALDLAEALVQVETFYADQGLPARYQISPATQPAELDQILAERGYAAVAHTAVQTTELATILRQTQPLRSRPEFEVEVMEGFDAGWFDVFRMADAGDGAQDDVLIDLFRRIEPTAGFVLLRLDGAPAAVGLGVVEGAWLGCFCMATLPAFRRRGAASAVLRTLAIWGGLYDATHAYLQVMEQNTAAQSLYHRLGFRTLYHYHYREQSVGT